MRNWIDKGCPAPKHAPVIGNYEAYRSVIGGILEAAANNWTTWQSNRAALDEIASDGEEDEVVHLLSSWWASSQASKGVEAAELCGLADENEISLPLRRVPHGEEFEYSSKSMGHYLKRFAGRLFEMEDGIEVELVQSTKRGKGGYPWLLKKVVKKPVTQPTEQIEPPKPKAAIKPKVDTSSVFEAVANLTGTPPNPWQK